MLKVLVVDDDRDLQELIKDALEDDGCLVSLADDGTAALALLPHVRPDVIVSDVLMPRMDGIELCHRLLARPEYSAIPFILFSEDAEVEGRRRCPATAFLPKPFSLATLQTLVRFFGGAGG
ncbi:MAG TPA: response regulator [Herpetosiphonaceae bacterium]